MMASWTGFSLLHTTALMLLLGHTIVVPAVSSVASTYTLTSSCFELLIRQQDGQAFVCIESLKVFDGDAQVWTANILGDQEPSSVDQRSSTGIDGCT